MSFDGTITVGNLITIAVTIGSVGMAVWKISIRLQKMEWKMGFIWKQYAKEHKLNGHEGE